MTKRNDGGPAFARAAATVKEWGGMTDDVTEVTYEPYQGMSLRDYFAAKAMQGIVGSIRTEEDYLRLFRLAGRDNLKVSQWIARDAYKQADAMIAEREK